MFVKVGIHSRGIGLEIVPRFRGQRFESLDGAAGDSENPEFLIRLEEPIIRPATENLRRPAADDPPAKHHLEHAVFRRRITRSIEDRLVADAINVRDAPAVADYFDIESLFPAAGGQKLRAEKKHERNSKVHAFTLPATSGNTFCFCESHRTRQPHL